MEGRATLLGRLLLVASIAACAVFAAPRAHAQAGDTHLVFSEMMSELDGTDHYREYYEIANLGNKPWDPNNHWIWRFRYDVDANPPLFVPISGSGAAALKPILPGGVLLIEWGRPNDDGAACTPGPNVYCTRYRDDLGMTTQDIIGAGAVALFAPTANNATPDFNKDRMLAYMNYGTFTADEGSSTFTGTGANVGKANGSQRAAALGLWPSGGVAPNLYNWDMALRWAPGPPFDPQLGRRPTDYYLTQSGLPDLTTASQQDVDADGNAILSGPTYVRQGTPGKPNLLHPGTLLPPNGGGNSYMVDAVVATAATLAANAPPTGVEAILRGVGGDLGDLQVTDKPGDMTVIGGPAVGRPALVNNAAKASRSLYVVAGGGRAVLQGVLAVPASGGAPVSMGFRSVIPGPALSVAAAVNAAGDEFVATRLDSGKVMGTTIKGGATAAIGAVAEATGMTSTTAISAASTDAGFIVVGQNGNQIVASIMGADGKFSPVINVGAAAAGPASVAPVAIWNDKAKHLEVLRVVLDSKGNPQLQHMRVDVKALSADVVGAPANVSTLYTDAAPGVAVDTDTGRIRVIGRGANFPVPNGDAANPPFAGAVLESSFDGTNWSAAKRIGTGQIPLGISPTIIYNPNAKRYEIFLIGDDNNAYYSSEPAG